MSVITPSLSRIGIGLTVWAASLFAALAIRDLPGDWGHAICGPWGCGPPLQALLACHMAWLIILAPPAALLARSTQISAHGLRRFGAFLCVLAALFVAAAVIYQGLTWWPSESQWQRGFFWRRCAFVLATTVDLPVAQLLLVGLYLRFGRLH